MKSTYFLGKYKFQTQILKMISNNKRRHSFKICKYKLEKKNKDD